MTTSKHAAAPRRERRASLERRAFALSACCPADRSNPPDCPLHGLRPMSARARRGWLHQLTRDELEYLLAYHQGCLAERTAAPAAQNANPAEIR